MSWFPSFLSPLAAILAAAVAVPALLVLYFLKLRRREMEIASTFLWKKAIQDLQVNAPFQKLRRNLLLFLQMLLLLLLCLALSRPVSNYTPGAGKSSVILIDRSASMAAKDVNGHTRLEEAKKRAKSLVDSMNRGSAATVIAFDDSAETIQQFTTDTVTLRRQIDSIQQTDRPSKLKLAYQLAAAQMAFIPENLRPGQLQLPDVWLYSDGHVSDAKEITLRANLHYDKIGTDTAANIGIVALSAKRNYERPTEVQVFARLANYGTEPQKADVQLNVTTIDSNGVVADTAINSIASVSLPPDRWSDPEWVKTHKDDKKEDYPTKDSVEFSLELTSAAIITVRQTNTEGDLLAADDMARVVVPPPKPLSVLLVTAGNYYLEKAMGSLDLKNPQIMAPTSYEEKVPKDFDVIIFDSYSPKNLPDSGNFLCFYCVPQGLKLKQAMDANNQPEILEDATVLDWNRDHPILRFMSLSKIYSQHQLRLEVPPEDQILIEGLKGPMLLLHHEGRSMFMVVSFDILQGNWPLKPNFPAFMQNALQFMAVGADLDVKQSYDPGSTPRIPRTNLQKAEQNLGKPGAKLERLTLNGPMGSRELKIDSAGDFVLPALDRTGVYSTDPQIPQYERLSVNLLDPNESNLIPLDTPPGGVSGESFVVTNKKSRLELWWWIVACAALPLLLIEWWVYTRRVHL
jgi:hypothetical protein